MLFNTLPFLLLLPVLFFAYWIIPTGKKIWRNGYLLAVSYLLYANYNPSYTLVLMLVTLLTYGGGILVDKRGKRLHTITFFAILSLLPLLVFKYYNFINENIYSLLSFCGVRFHLPGLNWAIPVGISFYTFQALGYLFDVYRGKTERERNFLDYALFVSFFPQTASGPISKASELLPQIKSIRPFRYGQAISGLRLLLWGMFLKVVIADRAGIYVDTVFDGYEKFSGLACVMASVLYSIQIYTDFAGYSLMAVGVGKLFGFDLVNNFQRPYFSASISEFWRRWHISLSRWLKDYVFIPLGGSKCSKARNYRNIVVTFLVSGIWHGANWTFIVWGLVHGTTQIAEKILGWNKQSFCGSVRLIHIVMTFVTATMAWVVFRSASIPFAIDFMSHYLVMSGNHSAGGITVIYTIMGIVPLLVVEVLQEFFPARYTRLRGYTWLRWSVYVLLFSMILLNGVVDGSSFIYVSF